LQQKQQNTSINSSPIASTGEALSGTHAAALEVYASTAALISGVLAAETAEYQHQQQNTSNNKSSNRISTNI
jgi:hypothetical protein